MPRIGRGGRRTGTPGKSYQNRTDLNDRSNVVPMMAAKGQAYGEAKAQMDAQRSLPVAAPPPPATAPPAGPAGPGAATAPGPALTPLGAPTARPGEPVTAGVPVGPGPNGVEMPGADDLRMRLGAIYQAFPTEEIRQLIEMLDSEPR